MNISTFPKHLFWSYSNDADIPEEVVAEQVIRYGDLEDLFQLSALVSSDVIAGVNRRIASQGHWLKRCNFVDKIILG